MRRRVGIACIAVGGALVLGGELSGVFSDDSWDTVTEWVTWLAVKSYGTALVAVLAGLGWLAYHFIDNYRTAKRR